LGATMITGGSRLVRRGGARVYLTPSDTEKLLLSVAGMVARDRRDRGIQLNYPEATALISCWAIERAREGASVAHLMNEGRRVLSRDDVMEGVPEMMSDVQVEATFPDGRKLARMRGPIVCSPARSVCARPRCS